MHNSGWNVRVVRGIINLWLFKKKKEYYDSLLKEIETILTKNSVTPIHLFKDKKILEYLTFFPLINIYCFLNQKNINQYINEQGRDFARFIMKLGKIKKRSINLLLDSPADYEIDYPFCVGWKHNPKYEEEVRNYKIKLEAYEKQKKILDEENKKIWKKPEAETYLFVKKEDNLAKCPSCFGSGRIPSVRRSWGYSCSKCRGTGAALYLPKVTPVQRRTAAGFEKELENLRYPEFSAFPRKKKSIYIRVIHGGQIFLVEK